MTNPTLELHGLRDSLIAQARSEGGLIGSTILNLRRSLKVKNKSDDRIDELVYRAENDLNIAILDIVTDNLQRVQQLAVEYGIDDFVENVHIQANGGSFEIAVIGGKTDFSTPAVEMLPSLLRAGKTSKDGSVYRVIPLPTVREFKTRSLSNVDAMQARAEEIKKERIDHNRQLDAGRMAKSLASSAPRARMDVQVTPAVGKEFRTATSKQDQTTQWVRPARDINITNELMDINSRMAAQIRDVTQSIIHRYGG